MTVSIGMRKILVIIFVRELRKDKYSYMETNSNQWVVVHIAVPPPVKWQIITFKTKYRIWPSIKTNIFVFFNLADLCFIKY